jgi:5'-deoxynucleotidase YfbR-like HD superfamily hydrolase
VYDHTIALIELAHRLSPNLNLTEPELDELCHMLEIHDWPEAIVGDEYIPNEDAAEFQSRKIEKAKREAEAMGTLLKDKEYAMIVRSLWDRYEAGADRIAKLAKELDKFQSLEQSLAYETEHALPLFVLFDEYYIRDQSFSEPEILSRIEGLREKHAALQRT